MKALVGAFNQEKALVGAFSMIVETGCGTDGALHSTITDPYLLLAQVHHILEWEGRKLGIIGLVEREWLDTGDCDE